MRHGDSASLAGPVMNHSSVKSVHHRHHCHLKQSTLTWTHDYGTPWCKGFNHQKSPTNHHQQLSNLLHHAGSSPESGAELLVAGHAQPTLLGWSHLFLHLPTLSAYKRTQGAQVRAEGRV